jgi:hypothetical protein
VHCATLWGPCARLGCAPGHEDRRRHPLEHRFVTRVRVVRPIPGHLPDRIGNLRQQKGDLLTIVYPTRGELHSDDLFAALINPQV